MLIVVFLVWSSNIETCNARRGKHWRHNRGGISTSMYKKKGKNHHGNAGKGKQKPQKSPPIPPPPAVTYPPSTKPPKKDYGNQPPVSSSSSSTVYNVLAFGAKGDGATDDTKVINLNCLSMHSFNVLPWKKKTQQETNYRS